MSTRFIIILMLLMFAVNGFAQASATGDQKLPGLWLGTAWYPEHWPEERWERDLQLMKAAGINFVRIGEFAWSRMEPQEGKFQLEWLDR
jgi:beta-galactosidase